MYIYIYICFIELANRLKERNLKKVWKLLALPKIEKSLVLPVLKFMGHISRSLLPEWSVLYKYRTR